MNTLNLTYSNNSLKENNESIIKVLDKKNIWSYDAQFTSYGYFKSKLQSNSNIEEKINFIQICYNDFIKENSTITEPQNKTLANLLRYMPTKSFRMEYSEESEIVLVRTHEKGETILVIDEDGEGFVSFAAKLNPVDGFREFFRFENYNPKYLIKKFFE